MSFELEPTRNFGSGMAALRATFSSVRDRVEAVGASKRSERAKKIHMTPGKFKSLKQLFVSNCSKLYLTVNLLP